MLRITDSDGRIRMHGFTLIELLVVIAIIGLLSSVILSSLNVARSKAKNSRQKADLAATSKALELYYNDHQAYPSTSGAWQGDAPGYGNFGYDAAGYIPGLAPQYAASLAINPNRGHAITCVSSDNGAGYLYRSDGKDYKLLAHCTPEGILEPSDPFYDPIRPTYTWQVSSPGAINW